MTPQHAAALEYAKRGWAVFPVEPPVLGDRESGKRPIAALVPHGKDDATTDPATISAWWAQCPNANIGIALDKSGLVVLDVDIGLKKDGTPKQGRKSLEEFDAELGRTLTALTGGGGLHAVYDACGAPVHALELREGLDIIGHGYIVAPPSLHYTGGTYRWNDLAPITPVPEVLRRAVTAKAQQKVQLSTAQVGSEIGEGGRNVALFRLGAALRAQGIGAEALARALDAENKQRCKPPLADYELANIVNSVLQRVQPERDVAAGAIVQQELQQMFAPKAAATRVGAYRPTTHTPQRFYPTSFPKLNELTGGGLATRHHLGIIGPPACGKSGFVNELVLEQQRYTPVLIYSAELPIEEVRIRLAARLVGFPWRDGMRGAIAPDVIERAVASLNIWIVGADEINREDPVGQIYYEAERIKSETGYYPAVFEDYVQLLTDGSDDKVRHKVGQLSKNFRVMSQRLDVPVVAVYSTSRAFYGGKQLDLMRKSDDPTAYLGAAKECGDIEYHCATLVYLDLDKLHEGQPKPARVAVARARVGDVGFVGARAQLDCGKWFADQSAVSELSADERNSRLDNDRLDRDIDRVLQVFQRMEGRPLREIKMAAGLDYRRFDTAKARLIEAGRLELVRETSYDSLHRKVHKDTFKVAGNSASAPDVSEEENGNASQE